MIVMAILLAALGWIVLNLVEDRWDERRLATASAALFAETARLAQTNNPVAQYQLARMYRDGNGVPIDNLEAQIWLERRPIMAILRRNMNLAWRYVTGVVSLRIFRAR